MKARFMKYLLSISALALLCTATTASATVLFEQPTDNYYGYFSYSTSQLADDFSIASGGAISMVKWWGLYVNNTPSDNFTLRFYSNDSGLPGTNYLVDYNIGSSANRTDTGINSTLHNKDIYEYTYNLPASFNASTGSTYWISILNGTTLNWAWADKSRFISAPSAWRDSDSTAWVDGGVQNRAF